MWTSTRLSYTKTLQKFWLNGPACLIWSAAATCSASTTSFGPAAAPTKPAARIQCSYVGCCLVCVCVCTSIVSTQFSLICRSKHRQYARVKSVLRPHAVDALNQFSEMTIDINAMCLDRTQTYILMIEQRQSASCTVLNPAIARCNVPRIYDWASRRRRTTSSERLYFAYAQCLQGTKTLYFQPQSGRANDEKVSRARCAALFFRQS